MPISKPTTTLDQTDLAIIKAFQNDGRQNNREVGRQLGLSEGAIRQRLKRLQESGIVRFNLVVDTESAGLEFGALLKISVEPGTTAAFLDVLAEFPQVTYAAAMSGRYNVFAFVMARSHRDAAETVLNKIEGLPGLNELDVRVVSHQTKHAYHDTIVTPD